jgi:hypothetical protein
MEGQHPSDVEAGVIAADLAPGVEDTDWAVVPGVVESYEPG